MSNCNPPAHTCAGSEVTDGKLRALSHRHLNSNSDEQWEVWGEGGGGIWRSPGTAVGFQRSHAHSICRSWCKMSHFDHWQTHAGDFTLPLAKFLYQPATKGGVGCRSALSFCSGARWRNPSGRFAPPPGITRIQQKSHFPVGKQWSICTAHMLILCFSAGQKEDLLIK